jgi:hypothetical protein
MNAHEDINFDRRRFLTGRIRKEHSENQVEFDVQVPRCTFSTDETGRSFLIDYSIVNLGTTRATVLVHRRDTGSSQVIKMLHLGVGETFHGTWKEPSTTVIADLAIKVEARCRGETVTTLHRPTPATPASQAKKA